MKAPRMVTILDPRLTKDTRGPIAPETLTVHDFISVPALTLRGEWPIMSLLPSSKIRELAIFANTL